MAQPLRAAEGIAINNDSTYAPQPRLQVDLDDGSTCSVTDRSPPTVVFGRWREGEERAGMATNGAESLNRSLGMGGGVALLVPLGGTSFKNTCSGLLQMQMNRAKLALAQPLLEAGHISADDETSRRRHASVSGPALSHRLGDRPRPVHPDRTGRVTP
ncbi:MAG: hypothetical protein VKP70_00025 [Cyanobacteriota bacterium]|nr:hypothetical protein [Cyanobacteriota bacterium]